MTRLILFVLGLIVFAVALALIAAFAIGAIMLEPRQLAIWLIIALVGLVMIGAALYLGDC